MSGRVHTREFKLTIARQLANGEKRPAQVCREHNLAPSAVSRWRNKYDQHGEAAFNPPASSEPSSLEAKIAELERFCGQLALENSLLKKALGKKVIHGAGATQAFPPNAAPRPPLRD